MVTMPTSMTSPLAARSLESRKSRRQMDIAARRLNRKRGVEIRLPVRYRLRCTSNLAEEFVVILIWAEVLLGEGYRRPTMFINLSVREGRGGDRGTMATCECGFSFLHATLDGRGIESYAVVDNEDYQRVIDDELAIRLEVDEERKLALIAEGSKRVGSLYVCPECGAMVFSKPQGSSTGRCFQVLKESSGPGPAGSASS